MWDWLKHNGVAVAAAVAIIGLILNLAGKLEFRLDDIEKGIVSLQSRFETIEYRLDGIDKRLDVVASRFDAFESSVNSRLNVTEGRIEGLKKQIKQIADRISLIQN